jgi:quercetin dioxygenase-like cupin family protein
LIFSLHEHPDGVAAEDGPRVVYDLARGEVTLGAAQVDGPALVWELAGNGEGAALAAELDLDAATEWVVRCDRVDFPPGSVAYRHVHPGPGIRRLLSGALTIEAEDDAHTYRPGESWFEGADDPVLATASRIEDTAFVRVLLLPTEWAGKRTIRYVDPADEERPKLQRATILLEEKLQL